jgi:hypothetical protein
VLVYAIMGMPQSRVQCTALLLLSLAAALASLDPYNLGGAPAGAGAEAAYKYGLGLGLCVGASAMSGLASTLTQVATQTHARNAYLYSIELALYQWYACRHAHRVCHRPWHTVHTLVVTHAVSLLSRCDGPGPTASRGARAE